MGRTLSLIGRVLRNVRRHGITTSDILDEDVLDELNQGQNQIISEINTEKSVTIALLNGVDSYALSTDVETVTQETTMKDYVRKNLIGTKNGINAVFTYPTIPDENYAITVFLNGVKLNPDTEYEMSITTTNVYITLLISPLPTTGDYVDSLYFEKDQ